MRQASSLSHRACGATLLSASPHRRPCRAEPCTRSRLPTPPTATTARWRGCRCSTSRNKMERMGRCHSASATTSPLCERLRCPSPSPGASSTQVGHCTERGNGRMINKRFYKKQKASACCTPPPRAVKTVQSFAYDDEEESSDMSMLYARAGCQLWSTLLNPPHSLTGRHRKPAARVSDQSVEHQHKHATHAQCRLQLKGVVHWPVSGDSK